MPFDRIMLSDMNRIDQQTVAQALLSAPGWARIGITDPKPSLRQDAAEELAKHILDCAERPQASHDTQSRLPL